MVKQALRSGKGVAIFAVDACVTFADAVLSKLITSQLGNY